MDIQFTESEITTALSVFNALPDYVCWKNLNLEYVMLNDLTARLFGFRSSTISFQGITDFDLNCDAATLADEFRQDDQSVLDTGKDLTIIDYCRYQDAQWKLLFGRKSLLTDSKGKAKGIYSRFLEVTEIPILRMIHGLHTIDQERLGTKANALGQVNYIIKERFDDFGLSVRESEVLFFLIRGKTAKEIARAINLSFRTVEKHLDRIKTKMHCRTRSQLIEKAIVTGIGAYLPCSQVVIA